jgi:uncharacterized protein (TIGR01244 family)
MRLIAILLACAVLALNACSVEKIAAPDSPAKVDLEQIVLTGKVEPVGNITPAGQPDAAALKVFADNGYAAVIDLRRPGEDRGLDEKAAVEGLGMTYVSMPIGGDGINYESARALDELLAGFDEPVLLHCGSSNRVGALLALRASLAGADDEEALRIGLKAGLSSLEPAVRDALNSK